MTGTLLLLLALLAVPRGASAATDTTAAWQCRASGIYASIANMPAPVEPLVANGIKGSTPGLTFDKPLCSSDEQGAGNTGGAVPIVDGLLFASAAQAKTTITPQTGAPKAQSVTASTTLAQVNLKPAGLAELLSVGAIKATATATCKAGKPEFNGTSILTDLKVLGAPVSLDGLVSALKGAVDGLGLGALVAIDTPNKIVKTANGIVVQPLRIRVAPTAGSPNGGLLDIVIGETKIGASGDVCNSDGPPKPPNPEDQICPTGSVPQGREPIVCVIPGTDRYGVIVIGVPNSTDTPRGGTVIPLVEARRLAGLGQLPKSKCLYGPGNDYVVVGTAKGDKIYGTRGPDRILGLGGSDKLYGVDGNDCLDGNAGADRIYGGEGNDRIYGAAGGDRLYGGNGNDRIYGDAGNDSIHGDPGNDRLSGGAGNDFFTTGTSTKAGGERVFTGPATSKGRNIVSIGIYTKPVVVNCGSSRDVVRANKNEARNNRLRNCKHVEVTTPTKKR